MGAIGIGRAFTYGGAKNRGMTDTIDHFRTKLTRLEARMKTKEGKRLAFIRTQRLKIFGRWWQEEMGLARAETGDMAWVQEVPAWVENASYKEGGHNDNGPTVQGPDSSILQEGATSQTV